MNKLIEYKLETLRSFQEKHPTMHVGGSIGLMIRGIELKRDLSESDLDITIDEYEFNPSEGMEERSDGNDFDYSIKQLHKDGCYTKIDVRVNPEPSFEKVMFNGFEYNVSKKRDILFWKLKYAKKGNTKHEFDLIVIETGERPSVPVVDYCDDLPF